MKTSLLNCKTWLSDSPGDHKIVAAHVETEVVKDEPDFVIAEFILSDNYQKIVLEYFMNSPEDLNKSIQEIRILKQTINAFYRTLKDIASKISVEKTENEEGKVSVIK